MTQKKIKKIKSITPLTAFYLALHLKVDFNRIPLEMFYKGVNVELEHGSALQSRRQVQKFKRFKGDTNITNDDLTTTGLIALAHLNEHPYYYKALEKMEKKLEKS